MATFIKRRTFVQSVAAVAIGVALNSSGAYRAVGKLIELKFGFIKLTDMVPLAIAYEKGYFEDEGLYVTIEAQANWKVLFDRLVNGELDGAHTLAAMPAGAATGILTKTELVSPFTLCRTTARPSLSPIRCGRK